MAALTDVQRSETVAEWQRAVEALLDQVEAWTRNHNDWRTERTTREITEQELGTYTIQGMSVETPEGRLELEPVARMIFGGRGSVQLRAWPTLFRVRLVRGQGDGEWNVITDSHVRLRQGWNETTFNDLKTDLLDFP